MGDLAASGWQLSMPALNKSGLFDPVCHAQLEWTDVVKPGSQKGGFILLLFFGIFSASSGEF